MLEHTRRRWFKCYKHVVDQLRHFFFLGVRELLFIYLFIYFDVYRWQLTTRRDDPGFSRCYSDKATQIKTPVARTIKIRRRQSRTLRRSSDSFLRVHFFLYFFIFSCFLSFPPSVCNWRLSDCKHRLGSSFLFLTKVLRLSVFIHPECHLDSFSDNKSGYSKK